MRHSCITHRISLTLVASFLFLCGNDFRAAAATLADLRCEYLADPLGIDVVAPRLSWLIDSDQRGEMQTAYQILVASSAEKLAADQGDLWDSGKVASRVSTQIAYAGKPLVAHQQCFWKVRVWTAPSGEASWSKPARWSMGILTPDGWKARWIGLDDPNREELLTETNWIWHDEGNPAEGVAPATRYFRREFTVPADRPIKNVVCRIAADDKCMIYFNGRELGGRNGHKSTKEMDLTSRVQPGRNVFALSGTNDDANGGQPNPAALILWMRIEFESGEPLILVSDEKWKSSAEGPEGWNQSDFDDAPWKAAKNIGPVGMQPWGDVQCAEDRRLPARYLRKEFALDKPVRRAVLYASGLGLSEFYLNGAKVGDHVLSPGATQYDKRQLYVTHDVTAQVKAGKNALGVILGNGRFYSPRSKVYANMSSFGFPKLLLHLRIEHEDGSISEIVSDDAWKLTTAGPIIANNEYDGEEYDARQELGDFAMAGYDDAKWGTSAIVKSPGGVVSAQMAPPIRVVETIPAMKVTEPSPGVFVYDLGQNIVGWCRLKVRGDAGVQVKLRHAETLLPDGNLYLANLRGAKVTDIYTLKGAAAVETWEPRFTYHGFRFVEVTGFPGKPPLDAIEGCFVHDDLRVAGKFACSSELVNKIYDCIVRGTAGNYRSFPTDCPQRDERQGWLGDRGDESRGEAYLFEVAPFHSKWLQDIADEQKESGSVSDVCPAHWPLYSDNVTWPSTTVLLPNTLHRQYGDRRIVARHYDSAKRWMDYIHTFVKDGIIERDSYGDWCVPPEEPRLIHSQDPARQTSKPLLATSYLYYDNMLMAKYAKMLGKTEDAAKFAAQAETLKRAFNAKFLDATKGYYDNGTQTSCVLPLYFGLVSAEQEQAVFAHLVKKIADESHNHIGTGLIGGQFLNRVLADRGRSDLAYTIASQQDYPSWGYMVSQGATTIWELWNGNTADPAMNSGNHVMLVGDLVVWMYENLAGIRPDEERPGFQHIIMRPEMPGDLKFVQAKHLTPYGWASSEWHREDKQFAWQVVVPPNAEATLFVPAKDAASVLEAGKPIAQSPGVKVVGFDRGRVQLEVGAGKYDFHSTLE